VCNAETVNNKHGRTQNFSFGGGEGGAAPEAIYSLCLIKNYVVRIMSKSPSGHLVRLQGKLNLTEKE
jgi:hypothetical protein